MVYKHAISTVVPARNPRNIQEQDEGDDHYEEDAE